MTNISRTLLATGGSVVLIAGAALLYLTVQDKKDADESAATPELSQPAYTLATSTLPIAVGGVVTAANRATIYAETAGAMREILAHEGEFVSRHMLLAAQDTPIADAELALVRAQQALTETEMRSAIVAADGAALQGAVRARSAESIAALRTFSTTARVQEATEALDAALEGSLLSMLQALDFVDTHRWVFTSEGLSLYEDIVTALYDEQPAYLATGVRGGTADGRNILDALARLRADETLSPVAMQELALVTLHQLQALSDLLETGEEDVFDEKTLAPSDPLYAEYLMQRNAIVASVSSLRSVLAELQRAVDTAREDAVSQGQSVSVSDIDKAVSENQARITQVLASHADSVAAAGVSLAGAQKGLGSVTAPFDGTISDVLVEAGEYVSPGQPLFIMSGSGAREVEVTVPSRFLPHLSRGAPFVHDGRMVGLVDRFTQTAHRGGVSVFITLLDTDRIVGESISGDIVLSVSDMLFRLPRAYAHFDSTGPYIVYSDHSRSPVDITYDAGTALFVTVAEHKPLSLLPAFSISL